MPNAHHVLRALKKAGWTVVRQKGSHRKLVGPHGQTMIFAYHDRDELGTVALLRLAKSAGLSIEELRKLL